MTCCDAKIGLRCATRWFSGALRDDCGDLELSRCVLVGRYILKVVDGVIIRNNHVRRTTRKRPFVVLWWSRQ